MRQDFLFVVSIWSEVGRKAGGPSAKRPQLRHTLPTVFEFEYTGKEGQNSQPYDA